VYTVKVLYFVMIIPMTNTITSKEQFQQEIAHEGVSIVDFYADWCGPCRMVGPIMEELQADNTSKGVKVFKINVDEHPDIASEFGVSSIPAVFFIKNGEVKEGIVGANPKNVYQEKIETYLAFADDGFAAPSEETPSA
jgi:thioredoxin 1